MSYPPVSTFPRSTAFRGSRRASPNAGPARGSEPTAPQLPSLSIPPQNLEAEMATLGCLLLGDVEAIEKAVQIVGRDDFYRDAHAHIFDAMLALARKSEPVDIVTVRDELTRKGILEQVGGVPFLVQLGDVQFTSANVASYAQIVADRATERNLLDELRLLAAMTYEGLNTGALVEEAERRIFAIGQARRGGARKSGELLRPLLDASLTAISDQYHNKGHLTGVSTGFFDLDAQTSGLQKGDLVLLPARPSMGKSAMASQMATDMSKSDESVVFFSLEMSRQQIMQRILCAEARVNASHVRSGYMSDADWRKICEAVERLWDGRALIDDNNDATIEYIRSVCRRHKAEYGLSAVFVDYVQLIRPSGIRYGGGENRNVEMGEISRD